MRNAVLRAYALGVITGSMVTAGLTMFAAPARADISASTVASYSIPVCATLDRVPTFNGVMLIAAAIAEDGYTYSDAGEIILGAALNVCPEFIPLLRQFAARYAPSAAVA